MDGICIYFTLVHLFSPRLFYDAAKKSNIEMIKYFFDIISDVTADASGRGLHETGFLTHF